MCDWGLLNATLDGDLVNPWHPWWCGFVAQLWQICAAPRGCDEKMWRTRVICHDGPWWWIKSNTNIWIFHDFPMIFRCLPISSHGNHLGHVGPRAGVLKEPAKACRPGVLPVKQWHWNLFALWKWGERERERGIPTYIYIYMFTCIIYLYLYVYVYK